MKTKAASQFVALAIICISAAAGGFAIGSQTGKEYNDADKELNSAYQTAVSITVDPEDRLLLIEAQKAWIKFRDTNVAFHGRYFPTSKGGLFIATDMTRERTKYLKMLATDESKAEHQNR